MDKTYVETIEKIKDNLEKKIEDCLKNDGVSSKIKRALIESPDDAHINDID